MSAEKPLDGKRIVITRAVEQSGELKDRLEKLGASVLLLPAVSFSEPVDTSVLDRAIASLESYDWVLFTSANAVRFFANRCRKAGVNVGVDERPRCAAVGPATASAMAAEGFTIDYVAEQYLGVALARELGSSLSGKRVLLPRSERAGRDLPDALRSVGAEVTEAVAYRTGGIGAAEPEVMEAVREARVDVVSFFSRSAVENLRDVLSEESLSRLGERTALAAVSPVTAAALRNAGLPVAIQPEEATTESMAKAIAKYFSTSGAPQERSL